MTLSILGTKKYLNTSALKTAYIYLLVSLFCVAFGLIYEEFSHGVYSRFMIYAFLFPLFGGLFPFFTMSIFSIKYPNTFTRMMYHPMIATFTVGFFVKGGLNIYGTTSNLISVYWIAGLVLFILSIIGYIVTVFKK